MRAQGRCKDKVGQLLVAFMLVGVPAHLSLYGHAQAKDLDALAKILEPAYLAMNYAVICATHQSAFLGRSVGREGNAFQYAEHIKNDVIDQLTEAEAIKVVRSAADGARSRALAKLRAFGHSSQEHTLSGIAAWCNAEALDFITQLIATHDQRHEELASWIENAKR